MKVLYIAPYKNFSSKDAGYGNASLSYLEVLKYMKDNKHISELTILDARDNKDIQTFDTSKQYDIAFVVAHPSSFFQQQTIALFEYLLKNSKQKYLHN